MTTPAPRSASRAGCTDGGTTASSSSWTCGIATGSPRWWSTRRSLRTRTPLPRGAATSSSSRWRVSSSSRRPGGENAKLPTGEIEVRARELTVLSEAKTPPFYINEPDAPVDESVRLQYRYLDIRREPMLRRLLLRSRLVEEIRLAHHANGFVEIETPILIKSTPGGCPRLHRAVAAAARHRLRAPAEPAAAQAAADGRRRGPLLPDRALLPRRGPSGRPPAGVHPARPRDELRDGGDRDRLRGGDGDQRLARRHARSGRSSRCRSRASRTTRRWSASARTSRTCASAWSSPTSAPRSRTPPASRPPASACSTRRSRAAGASRRSRSPGLADASRARIDELTEAARRYGARGLVTLAVTGRRGSTGRASSSSGRSGRRRSRVAAARWRGTWS